MHIQDKLEIFNLVTQSLPPSRVKTQEWQHLEFANTSSNLIRM